MSRPHRRLISYLHLCGWARDSTPADSTARPFADEGGGWWRPLAHDVLYNQVDALFVYCAEQVALIGEDHMAAPYSH